MKNTLIKYKYPFESSSGYTPQFKSYWLSFNREMKTLLKSIGATDIDLHRGHFYTSGFFKMPDGQWWYISQSDLRSFKDGKMLIRTASGPKDYTGGVNQYVRFDEDLRNNILRVVKR